MPETWKNKLTYEDEILEIFSKDENFLGYLGKGNAKKDTEASTPTRTKNMSATAYSNFPKIDSGTVISSNQSSNRPITAKDDTDNGTIKTTSGRGKFLSTKSKNEMNDKEVVSILEDFRIAR